MSRNMRKISEKEWEPIPWIAEMPRDEDPSLPKGTRPDDAQLTGLNNPPRLFYLLRTNGLAMEKGGVSFVSGPNTVIIGRATAERLNGIIRLA